MGGYAGGHVASFVLLLLSNERVFEMVLHGIGERDKLSLHSESEADRNV